MGAFPMEKLDVPLTNVIFWFTKVMIWPLDTPWDMNALPDLTSFASGFQYITISSVIIAEFTQQIMPWSSQSSDWYSRTQGEKNTTQDRLLKCKNRDGTEWYHEDLPLGNTVSQNSQTCDKMDTVCWQ